MRNSSTRRQYKKEAYVIPDRQVNGKVREPISNLLHHQQSKTHFIPLARIQQLRDLTRYHKTLIRERARQINHLQKVLETANIKPSNVLRHISSTSGRALVVAPVQGDNRKFLAEQAYRHNRANLQELYQTLEGCVPAHRRFLISNILSHLAFLDQTIQKVQLATERYILPSDKITNQLNLVAEIKPISRDILFSSSNVDINCLFYEKYLAPWSRVRLDHRKSSSKLFGGNAIRHRILRELVQTIVQNKDTFLPAFYHRQVCLLGEKRAIIVLMHKLLIISYHILRNNKSHQELVVDDHEQPNTRRLQQHPGYRLGPLVINCCMSICLMAGLAHISHSPFIFPSLGPTAFLFFYKPTDPSASPRNILIGHAIAIIVGYLSLVVTGLAAVGPAYVVGVTWPRIIAIGLSLGLTVGLMVLLRAPHPPAASTTLIISLGTMTKPWQLFVLMLAVVLITLQALIINRLAGIGYPLWRSQPV